MADIVSLLSTVLNEAVEDRRIPANPCRGLRLMKRRSTRRPVADPEQVLRIALRARHWQDAVLILTAAYTGMRWGELAGLRYPNVVLDGELPRILIDPATGALHEVAGKLYLGPPKTDDSIRQISLPPFLAEILADLHAEAELHPLGLMFTAPDEGFLRRSNFHRRVWVPAANGSPTRGPAIVAGMHFHDLRHTHKTWMIEDLTPEVLQAERLGHRLGGVTGIYSHTTQAMQLRLVAALENRWSAARTVVVKINPPKMLPLPARGSEKALLAA